MSTPTDSATHSPSRRLFRRPIPGLSGGFTLIELMVVVALAAVVVAIAAPAMTALTKSIKISSASNDLLASLLMARSEAVKRKDRVVICKSADGTSCASSGGWEQGWIVFHDSNNNGTHEQDEPILQHSQALATDLRLTGNQNVARYVSYAPSGAAKLVGGGFQAGTLTVCSQLAGAPEVRQIILSSAGRPRVQRAAGACA